MNNLKKLNDCIGNILHPILVKKKIYHGKIFLDWINIVGDRIAAFAWPKKVSSENKDEKFSILHLEVCNSSFATELRYLEQQLIEKISVFFGYKAISKIKIQVNLKEKYTNSFEMDLMNITKFGKEEALKKINLIEDENLKLALADLSILIKT